MSTETLKCEGKFIFGFTLYNIRANTLIANTAQGTTQAWTDDSYVTTNCVLIVNGKTYTQFTGIHQWINLQQLLN